MGYRSHGAFWASPSTWAEMVENYPHLIDDLESWWEEESRDADGVVFSFEYMKWYEGFAEIDAWEVFFNACDENQWAYDFIRIGENWDDNDCRTGFMFTLSRTWDTVGSKQDFDSGYHGRAWRF